MPPKRKISETKNNDEENLMIAKCYLNGTYHSKDPYKAIEFLNKSNNPEAKYMLAYIYFAGKYVNKDIKKALELFEAAAKCKHEDALNKLSFLYREGYGDDIKQDQKKALKYSKLVNELFIS